MAPRTIFFSALTITTVILTNNAFAFTVSIAHTPRRQQQNPRTRQTQHYPATIIGWDDESDSYSSTFDEHNNILEESGYSSDYQFTSIAESLSQSMEQTASLARLAVAFSPPEQAINLEDITQIHIIEVTNHHIELSAVVCDESQCVTLLIPVAFQHECSSSDTEECILENIFELDIEAQHVLKQRAMHKQYYLGNSEDEKELLTALYDNSDLQFPSWWTNPQSSAMNEECQQITKILNQDGFQAQVIALASQGLANTEDNDLFQIKRAAVCSIGPAGFYFRAVAVKKDEVTSSQSQITILEIPYSILPNDVGQSITDPAALRAAVLGAVTSVSSE